MKQKPIHVNEVLSTLEMPMDSWKLPEQRSKEEALAWLDNFKKFTKKQHHILVKRYHPDLPKNGEIEETKLKKINAIVDVVMKLSIIKQVPPMPQPVRPQNVRFYSFDGFGGGNTSTSASFNSSHAFTFRFK